MPLEFIYLNSPAVVAVNCDNRKAMKNEKRKMEKKCKEKWHKVKFEKSTKNDRIEFREQKTKNKKQKKNKKETKQ